MRALKIATRRSPLALWQAEHIADLIRAAEPGREVALLEMTTQGDQLLDSRLAEVGGKGLFVKEIEQALLEGRADLAVHSLKDMTSVVPPSLCLAAIPAREDPRDAWVSPGQWRLEELPSGAAVGTSSLRRACQLLERRPDLRVVPLRGNVQTRLRKTQEQSLAGSVLAFSGLRRLGLEKQVTQILEPEVILPAVGQGALAVECRAEDRQLLLLLAGLEHSPSRCAVSAERAFLAQLEGGCSVPLAGYATLEGEEIFLRGLIGSPDGKQVLRAQRRGRVEDAERVGRDLALELLERGGWEILATWGTARQGFFVS